MSRSGGGEDVMPSKNGGLRTYVDAGSHAKRSPGGTSSDFQRSSPPNASAYWRRNIASATHRATVSLISAELGQMSRRYTGAPELSRPSGSPYRSISILPASAYATTSGGEAR